MTQTKFEIYKDKRKEWRWTLRSANGRIIADGSEGYLTAQHCKRALGRVIQTLSQLDDIGLEIKESKGGKKNVD